MRCCPMVEADGDVLGPGGQAVRHPLTSSWYSLALFVLVIGVGVRLLSTRR